MGADAIKAAMLMIADSTPMLLPGTSERFFCLALPVGTIVPTLARQRIQVEQVVKLYPILRTVKTTVETAHAKVSSACVSWIIGTATATCAATRPCDAG